MRTVGQRRWFPAVFFFLAAGAVLLGCADRRHLNPLDPKNPDTGGKPAGLEVYSVGHLVYLSWSRIHVDGFQGMRIYRRQTNGGKWEAIAFVQPDTTAYVDTVAYGIPYGYALQAVTNDYESPLSDEETILAGPSVVWVTSPGGGMLAELSFDAAHRIFLRQDLIYPNGLAPAESGKGVWITDYYTSELMRVSAAGKILRRFLNVFNPLAVDYDTTRHRLWVALHSRNVVMLMDTTGRKLAEAQGFSYPVRVSVDQQSGVCWVADVRARRVVRLDAQSLRTQQSVVLFRPEDAAADPATGTCWVADSSRVVQIGAGGEIKKKIAPFLYALRVAVDPARQNIWVLDYQIGQNRSVLYRFKPDGSQELAYRDLAGAFSIAVDPYDGSCLVADTWNYRVLKIGRSGQVLGQWRSPSPPKEVRVQPL